MANFRNMTPLQIFCAICLYCLRGIDASVCDFGGPDQLLGQNDLAICDKYADFLKFETVICPRHVDGTEYAWHPQSTSADYFRINTYVGVNGKLRSVAHSHVVRSESGKRFFWVESDPLQMKLHFYIPYHEFVAINERRLIFICGPRNLVLTDALQQHIYQLSALQPEARPRSSTIPLTEEIAKTGQSLGVVFLYRKNMHQPLQGCGSRPSPLFAPDNEVDVDPETGTRSCVADPMSESPIGFLCEGRIEPENCMKSLINPRGKVATAPRPRPYWDVKGYGPWVVGKYFNDLALPPIDGECKCKDPKTGQVNAKIKIRSKTDYICDIASKILRNRSQPISGPWCSVVLHPGSTLTIKFPINNSNLEAPKEGDPTVTFSQMMSLHEYQTEFQPYNLNTLRQVTSGHDVDTYNEIPYHDALVGDALELDLSQMHRGEVMLKYHVGKALTLKSGLNSFYYQCTFTSNKHVIDSIRPVVNVSFAYTHHYQMRGCDRGAQAVFDPNSNRSYCSTISMGNNIRNTYECVYNMRQVRQAGIHCGINEVLLPGNCGSTIYDVFSDEVIPLPQSIKTATRLSIPGFQLFNIEIGKAGAFSLACFCLDQRGHETSRVVFKKTESLRYTFKTRRVDTALNRTRIRYMLLKTTDLLLEESTPTKLIMAHKALKKSITLAVGKRLILECKFGFHDIEAYHGAMQIEEGWPLTKWWPNQPDIFYYAVTHTKHGDQLIRKKYENEIITTPGDFKLIYRDLLRTERYQSLIIEAHKDSLIISKDPMHKYIVPLTFVCGKELEPADAAIIDGEVPASTTTHVLRSSKVFTWHLVEVNLEATDPYMQGCGVTYASAGLFKPETPKLYNAEGQEIGCKIDINTAGEAAFYCPAPYVLDPPGCFDQVSVNGRVHDLRVISRSLLTMCSDHFVTVKFDGARIGPGDIMWQKPLLECRCVTTKGIVLSTIQLEHYYAE
ncbi:hypothetical protein BBBOND_0306900 [Babesia bigemina]|uniref:6-Cys domain-containing protein n=1 Tax=Babesia bigemina TaxID=5866 RepID=A0A061D7X8_BABBI|nr:hypothetical protein BBBOND_0306900 [Babesia bigemina]CDR96786.1 hypothetical protein BBBOND_0306900 [Babesia bigemina]|eukprot:XP_012768972.1 hypothetical protein BBBOND_0306900 [Babesia bigemina]